MNYIKPSHHPVHKKNKTNMFPLHGPLNITLLGMPTVVLQKCGLLFLVQQYLYFVFVLMGWSLLPNALRPYKIYCAPSNLCIARTSICRLHFPQRPVFSGLRFFDKPEISDPGVPSGGLVLRIFTS